MRGLDEHGVPTLEVWAYIERLMVSPFGARTALPRAPRGATRAEREVSQGSRGEQSARPLEVRHCVPVAFQLSGPFSSATRWALGVLVSIVSGVHRDLRQSKGPAVRAHLGHPVSIRGSFPTEGLELSCTRLSVHFEGLGHAAKTHAKHVSRSGLSCGPSGEGGEAERW